MKSFAMIFLPLIVRYFSGENKLYNNVKGQIPSLTPGDGLSTSGHANWYR